ncbi:MAG: hypothetical protein SXA11_07810 [Cyanobacteriota bacterium]|nr:hypothetical protein [Cyanobacteriota bacterium]
MQIAINLPEELTDKIGDKWGNLEQKILEKFILEAFLEGLINFDELRETLGLKDDAGLQAFLSANIPLHNSGLLNLAGSCEDIDFNIDDLAVSDQLNDNLVGVSNE